MRKGLRTMLCEWDVRLVVTWEASSEAGAVIPLADPGLLVAVSLPRHCRSGIWKPCFAAYRCLVGMLLFTC
jgi:hypothetical protein